MTKYQYLHQVLVKYCRRWTTQIMKERKDDKLKCFACSFQLGAAAAAEAWEVEHELARQR
jgi:hypothetical protein